MARRQRSRYRVGPSGRVLRARNRRSGTERRNSRCRALLDAGFRHFVPGVADLFWGARFLSRYARCVLAGVLAVTHRPGPSTSEHRCGGPDGGRLGVCGLHGVEVAVAVRRGQVGDHPAIGSRPRWSRSGFAPPGGRPRSTVRPGRYPRRSCRRVPGPAPPRGVDRCRPRSAGRLCRGTAASNARMSMTSTIEASSTTSRSQSSGLFASRLKPPLAGSTSSSRWVIAITSATFDVVEQAAEVVGSGRIRVAGTERRPSRCRTGY